MDEKTRVIVLSERETFLVRVMVKKTKEAGFDCEFVNWSIDNINEKIPDAALVVLYMDESVRPRNDVIMFLIDKMTDEGIQMIIIGEKHDVENIYGTIPEEMIYKIMYRPIDNSKYVEVVSEVLSKIGAGEFRRKILIVDDDPGYLNLVRDWLKGTYKVYMANSGLQAIKMLGMNKVDLILLDNEMPVTTGPMVLEMLRNDDETRNIPVMFLTGKGDKESVMAVLALRPEGYFLKNIQKEDLLEKLKDFFILHK